MIALVLLAAVLPVAGNVTEACDETVVARARVTLDGKAAELATEVDRRAQLVLAEERRVEGEPRGLSPVASGTVAVCGLLLAALALTRRRTAVGLLGLVVATAGAGATIHLQRRDEARARQLVTLVRCRLMLGEARHASLATQLGSCTHRIDEADEDLINWESTLGRNGTLTLQQVTKMHGELKPR